MHNCNLGTMCLIRNATNDPSGSALCHGFNINFAERSEGCQFVRAIPNFSWITGYTDACNLSSVTLTHTFKNTLHFMGVTIKIT